MASIWDPTSGETYSYSGLEGKSREEILEELRRRRMATHAEPGEIPWDDDVRPLDQIPAEIKSARAEEGFWDKVGEGISESFPARALRGVGEKLDVPVPGAREAAEAAVQTPDIALPNQPNIPRLVKGAADAYSAVKEAIPAATEEFKSDKIRDAILADESLTDDERALELYRHEDPGLVERASRAVFAGAETTQRPDVQEQIQEDRVKSAGELAEIPTVVDAAAIALAPLAMGGATSSRLLHWGGRASRAVDALDAGMGVKDVMEGQPVQGAIRIAGGGLGAALPGPRFIDEVSDASRMADEVPSVHDVTTRMELETKGASEGLSDGELDQLQALDEAQETRETVQPMNVEPYEAPTVTQMEGPRGRMTAEGDAGVLGADRERGVFEAKRRIPELEREAGTHPKGSPEREAVLRQLDEVREQAELHPMGSEEFQAVLDENIPILEAMQREGMARRAEEQPAKALDDVYTQERTANITRLQAELDEIEEAVIDPQGLGTARDRMAAGQEFQAKQAELQSEMAQLEDYTSNQARANRMQELMNRPVTPEEAQELATLRGEHETARAARVERPMDEATQQVDEISGVEDEIAQEAMAAEEAALKQDLARQAGEVEQARTLEAGKPLSFRDYVAQKYPDGLPKKGRSRIGKEYRLWKERGYVEDIPPSEISGGKPPKKKPPLKRPGNLSPLDRTARRTAENIRKLMPEAGEMLDAVRNTRERGSAAAIHDVKQIINRVRERGMNEDNIIRYLDGEEIDLELPELKAAMEIRKGTRRIERMAQSLGIMEQGRAAYFPHYVISKGKAAGKMGPFRAKGKVPFSGHLEMARKTDANWIRDLDILENYYTEAWNKIAAAEHLGTKNQKLNKVVKRYQKLDPANKKYFEEGVRGIVKGAPMSSELGAKFRYYTAVMDLPLAALYQVGQGSATAAVGGVERSVREFGRLMVDSAYRAKMAAAAERSGATLPDVAMEILGNLKGGADQMLWGIPTMDKAMRVHAYAVGESMLSAAQAGDVGAEKAIQDILGFTADVKAIDGPTLGKALSDYTQFRTGVAEKPLWASSSEWGRFAYQYKHFAYHWGIMVGDLIKKREGGSLIKLALMGGAAGEVVGNVRALLKGYDPVMDRELQEESHGDPTKYLDALVTRSRRYPLSHPIHRALQNFGMVGGFGFFAEAMLDPVSRGGRGVEEAGNIFAAARRPLDVTAGAYGAVTSGEVDPLTRKLPGLIPGGFGYSGWADLLKPSHRRVGGRQGQSGSRVGGR